MLPHPVGMKTVSMAKYIESRKQQLREELRVLEWAEGKSAKVIQDRIDTLNQQGDTDLSMYRETLTLRRLLSAP